MKPAELVSVAGPLTGMALVCEALTDVLRVGVARAGVVLVAGGLVGAAGAAVVSSARLIPVNVADAIEAMMISGVGIIRIRMIKGIWQLWVTV